MEIKFAKALAKAEKQAVKAFAKAEREAKRALAKADKLAEKLAKKEAKKAEKLAKKEAKVAEKAAKAEAKKAEKLAKKEAKKAEKLAEKEAKKAEKLAEKLAKKEARELTEEDPSVPMEDRYTETDMRSEYQEFRAYYMSRRAKQARLGVRMPNMPEDISENIVKFILRNHLGVESYWARHVKKPGDLWSPTEGVQECKCFMSDGPASFGPNKTWDAIYFLDLRNWLGDEIVLYRTALSPKDEQWQNIRISEKRSKQKEGGELWRDQCRTRGARPHIGWEYLYPQIREHCAEVYRGTFEGIFAKREAMSSTTGTDTALPANA